MKKMLCLAIILVSIVAMTPASAQSFGELFPLTNTRYDRALGKPRLAANGSDFVLFWSTERKIRATSLAQGDARVGHVVLDMSGPFDVAWTGNVFLAVSSRPIRENSTDANIIGRVLDAEAQPLGDEVVLAEHGREPRLAAGPEAMVMVYRGTAGDTRILVLGPQGQVTGAESRAVPMGGSGYAVMANDSGFVVGYANTNELRTIKLDRQGRVVAENAYRYPRASYREIALATDGEQSLFAWSTHEGGETAAVLLDEDGAFGIHMIIDGGRSRSLSAVWTSDGWIVSREAKEGALQRTYANIYHLDPAVTRQLKREQSVTGSETNSSLAVLNERVMLAWSPVGLTGYPIPNPGGAASVTELPLAAHQPRVVTYGATQQTLLATASSADATLMVWTEHSDDGESLHTGVRTNDGQWTEQALTTEGVIAANAASDGTRFVVIAATGESQRILRLDAKGRPASPSAGLPGARAAIAWNGTRYAIITAGPGLEGRLLSPSGALSAPVKIPYNAQGDAFGGNLSLASNGESFLLAGEAAQCQFVVCGPRRLKGMRLGADLQRIDAEEITLDGVYGELTGAVWTGSEYVVVWRGVSSTLSTARVPATAGASIQVAHTIADILPRSVAPMPDGTVAVAGLAGSSGATHVAFLRNDGSIARTFALDAATLTGTPLLTKVPGGIAYVASSVQDAAPHHGTSHVMMAIARPSVTPPPGAPLVQARLDKGVIVVDWSAPAGTVNGYRIEVQGDGGSWNEVEEWFSPSAHQKAITPPSGTELAVRIRAFNDGGVSDYASATVTKPARRRAAR
jgi:hypothetical protein